MPFPTKMDFDFTAQELADTDNALDTLLNIINSKGRINLTPKERKHAGSVGKKRQPYVQKVYDNLAVNYQNLRPSFSDFNSARTNYSYAARIRQILLRMAEALEVYEEHAICAERLAYHYVLDFYSSAKQSAQRSVPGADTAVETLAPLFKHVKIRKSAPLPEGE